MISNHPAKLPRPKASRISSESRTELFEESCAINNTNNTGCAPPTTRKCGHNYHSGSSTERYSVWWLQIKDSVNYFWQEKHYRPITMTFQRAWNRWYILSNRKTSTNVMRICVFILLFLWSCELEKALDRASDSMQVEMNHVFCIPIGSQVS